MLSRQSHIPVVASRIASTRPMTGNKSLMGGQGLQADRFAQGILGKYGFGGSIRFGRMDLIFRTPNEERRPAAVASGGTRIYQWMVHIQIVLQQMKDAQSFHLHKERELTRQVELWMRTYETAAALSAQTHAPYLGNAHAQRDVMTTGVYAVMLHGLQQSALATSRHAADGNRGQPGEIRFSRAMTYSRVEPMLSLLSQIQARDLERQMQQSGSPHAVSPYAVTPYADTTEGFARWIEGQWDRRLQEQQEIRTEARTSKRTSSLGQWIFRQQLYSSLPLSPWVEKRNRNELHIKLIEKLNFQTIGLTSLSQARSSQPERQLVTNYENDKGWPDSQERTLSFSLPMREEFHFKDPFGRRPDNIPFLYKQYYEFWHRYINDMTYRQGSGKRSLELRNDFLFVRNYPLSAIMRSGFLGIRSAGILNHPLPMLKSLQRADASRSQAQWSPMSLYYMTLMARDDMQNAPVQRIVEHQVLRISTGDVENRVRGWRQLLAGSIGEQVVRFHRIDRQELDSITRLSRYGTEVLQDNSKVLGTALFREQKIDVDIRSIVKLMSVHSKSILSASQSTQQPSMSWWELTKSRVPFGGPSGALASIGEDAGTSVLVQKQGLYPLSDIMIPAAYREQRGVLGWQLSILNPSSRTAASMTWGRGSLSFAQESVRKAIRQVLERREAFFQGSLSLGLQAAAVQRQVGASAERMYARSAGPLGSEEATQLLRGLPASVIAAALELPLRDSSFAQTGHGIERRGPYNSSSVPAIRRSTSVMLPLLEGNHALLSMAASGTSAPMSNASASWHNRDRPLRTITLTDAQQSPSKVILQRYLLESRVLQRLSGESALHRILRNANADPMTTRDVESQRREQSLMLLYNRLRRMLPIQYQLQDGQSKVTQESVVYPVSSSLALSQLEAVRRGRLNNDTQLLYRSIAATTGQRGNLAIPAFAQWKPRVAESLSTSQAPIGIELIRIHNSSTRQSPLWIARSGLIAGKGLPSVNYGWLGEDGPGSVRAVHRQGTGLSSVTYRIEALLAAAAVRMVQGQGQRSAAELRRQSLDAPTVRRERFNIRTVSEFLGGSTPFVLGASHGLDGGKLVPLAHISRIHYLQRILSTTNPMFTGGFLGVEPLERVFHSREGAERGVAAALERWRESGILQRVGGQEISRLFTKETLAVVSRYLLPESPGLNRTVSGTGVNENVFTYGQPLLWKIGAHSHTEPSTARTDFYINRLSTIMEMRFRQTASALAAARVREVFSTPGRASSHGFGSEQAIADRPLLLQLVRTTAEPAGRLASLIRTADELRHRKSSVAASQEDRLPIRIVTELHNRIQTSLAHGTSNITQVMTALLPFRPETLIRYVVKGLGQDAERQQSQQQITSRASIIFADLMLRRLQPEGAGNGASNGMSIPAAAYGADRLDSLEHKWVSASPEASELAASPLDMSWLKQPSAPVPAAPATPVVQPAPQLELSQLEEMIKELPQLDIRKIADKVYQEIEKKMKFERQRRGI